MNEYKQQFDKNGYVIIDDFIDKNIQLEIKDLFRNSNFPWFYQKEATTSEKNRSTFPIFAHIIKINGKDNSKYAFMFEEMGEIAANYVGFEFNKNNVIRSYLQLPLNEKFVKNPLNIFHTDSSEKHLVLLYYVNDADGDTILSSIKFDGERFKYEFTEEDVMVKISPKQGRALIFDGSYYHSSEQCRNDIRCVINYNII